MAVRFVNNFKAPLAADLTSGATTILFASGYGNVFRTKLASSLGADHVYGTLYDVDGNVEYVRITGTTGDEFTVVRGVDNSVARAWSAGDYMACRPNAAALSEATGGSLTGYARSGINLDITELRGLTTPLSVAQGGTGVTSLAALASALNITSGAMPYIAPGTVGNVLTSNGTSWVSSPPTGGSSGSSLPSQTGNENKWLTTNGSVAYWSNPPAGNGLVTMAEQSGSGTVTFTGIPSNARRITVVFNGVASDYILTIRLGDSGGVETSGYQGYWTVARNILGIYGWVTLVHAGSNKWLISSDLPSEEGGYPVNGYKTLSSTLDRVQVTGGLNGTMFVMYE